MNEEELDTLPPSEPPPVEPEPEPMTMAQVAAALRDLTVQVTHMAQAVSDVGEELQKLRQDLHSTDSELKHFKRSYTPAQGMPAQRNGNGGDRG